VEINACVDFEVDAGISCFIIGPPLPEVDRVDPTEDQQQPADDRKRRGTFERWDPRAG